MVDVGSEDPPVDPFVFVTNGSREEYVTLSPLTTISATLEKRQKAIHLEDLPPTFRDAIILTRKLGFRYIWIDSLCIIKDSHEDWTAESTQMYEIYANASLNIAASAAKHPQQGMFASGN